MAFRRAPEEPGSERAPAQRRDRRGRPRIPEPAALDARLAAAEGPRLAEVGAATNKINYDLRNTCRRRGCCRTAWRAATTNAPAPWRPPSSTPSIARARLASDAIEYVRDRPPPRSAKIDVAGLVDEAGVALQAGRDSTPKSGHGNRSADGRAAARRRRPALPRVRQSRLRSSCGRHEGHQSTSGGYLPD